MVKHLNFKSTGFPVSSSGVPQNDHLPTLLFNIFINDHANFIKVSDILLFADDAKSIKIVKT
jgi:hypothetical protein